MLLIHLTLEKLHLFLTCLNRVRLGETSRTDSKLLVSVRTVFQLDGLATEGGGKPRKPQCELKLLNSERYIC